jgi:hypothetical protein
MSKLLSLSNSNSKNNSYNANGSKENKNSREIVKKNNFSNGSFNKSKGGEISSGNGSIESNNANITNINNSNSNNTNSNSNSNSTSNNNNNITNNNNGGQYSKNSIIAKRKKFYDKLMKKDLTKKSSNNNLTKENNIQNNLNKVFDSDQFDSIKNVPNNQSTSSNIKITNNTNIIVNVKSGTKSLDIRALNNNTNKDMMMRDMRELHIITKKAICSISTINPLLDTLDNFNEANKQRNYSNNKAFNKKPMKELLINDNTDFSINQLLINNLTIDKKYNYLNNPNININFNNSKPSSSQIINIININGGNYSMDQTKKKPIKNIPRSDLSSIKECTYDTPYMTNTTKLPQKKNIKFQQYEIDTANNFNNIKQCKTKINKINKLPNKKYSHNNWHGNTINTIYNTKTDNSSNNNKIVKKYIEHLRNTNKTISTNSFKKGTFIDINKSKNK